LQDQDFTVGDTRVTDFPSNPNYGFPFGLFIGDYFAIEATGEDVYMVWADTRLGEFGPMNQKIGFARERAISAPDIHITPSAGAGGQGITVQGFNYQPDMNIFIQVDDVTMATARTDSEGEFSTSIYMPVISEGAQNITVVDQSGNRAVTSFYTEFGFGDIERLLGDVMLQLDVAAGQPEISAMQQEVEELRALVMDGRNGGRADNGQSFWSRSFGWPLGTLGALVLGGLIGGGVTWTLLRGYSVKS
jgi:hypothetical protein